MRLGSLAQHTKNKEDRAGVMDLVRLLLDQEDVARRALGFLRHYDQLCLLAVTKATATSDLRTHLVGDASRVRIPMRHQLRAFEATGAFVSPARIKKVVCSPGAHTCALHEYANVDQVAVEDYGATVEGCHRHWGVHRALSDIELTKGRAIDVGFLTSSSTHLRKLVAMPTGFETLDLAAWSRLTTLQVLHFEGSVDTTNQLHLPQLRTLVVVVNRFHLNDRVSEATLGSLEELRMHGGVVETLAPVRLLRTLCLQGVRLLDPRSLESCRELRTLSVTNVDEEDTPTAAARLAQLANLEQLSLRGKYGSWLRSPLWSFDGLRVAPWSMEGGEALLCDANWGLVRGICMTISQHHGSVPFEQLAATAPRLGQLRELRLQVDLGVGESLDLAPLASLVHLEQLSVLGRSRKKRRADITPLAHLINLKQLKLQRVSLVDLEPLSKLVKLTVLDLAKGKVSSNVAPLAGLRKLERLDVRQTKLRDVAPLAELPRLRHLLVSTAVDCATIAATFPALQYLGHDDGERAPNCLETLHWLHV